MNDNDLERVLSQTEEIVPSSGFAASVMDAVREEAERPEPIPFPWKWTLPGFAVSVLMAVVLVVRGVHVEVHAGHSEDTALALKHMFAMLPQGLTSDPILLAVEWIGLALLVSLVAVWFSMRLAGGKE